MSDQIKKLAPVIWSEIQKANKILLSCHVRPDPDSIASVLATKAILENAGKKVVAISGDDILATISEFFPEASQIQKLTFSEAVRAENPDLFIALDSASPGNISSNETPQFPLAFKTINIDHHPDNPMYGEINLVKKTASCSEILYELFEEMKLEITPRIATILYFGTYADSGGFEYPEVSANTFLIASKLKEAGADILSVPHFLKSLPNNLLRVIGYCLFSSKDYFNSKVILTKISLEKFVELGIKENQTAGINKIIARYMNLSKTSAIVVVIYERKQSLCGFSFRADNPSYPLDVSTLGQEYGGGGHKGAASGDFNGTLDDAEKSVLQTIQKVYPDLGQP